MSISLEHATFRCNKNFLSLFCIESTWFKFFWGYWKHSEKVINLCMHGILLALKYIILFLQCGRKRKCKGNLLFWHCICAVHVVSYPAKKLSIKMSRTCRTFVIWLLYSSPLLAQQLNNLETAFKIFEIGRAHVWTPVTL